MSNVGIVSEIRTSADSIISFKKDWCNGVPRGKPIPEIPKELAKAFDLGESIQKDLVAIFDLNKIKKEHKDIIMAIRDDFEEIVQNIQTYYAKRWRFLSRTGSILRNLGTLTDRVSKFVGIFMTSIRIGDPPQANPDEILTDPGAQAFWKANIPA